MCLRLYINGDKKARNTHMSLFFVLMRGENDDNLKWPFRFKVTFTLIDQLATNNDQCHMTNIVCPYIKPICFGFPKADMNLPYGKSECFPLAKFEQYYDRYVQHDSIFIGFEIDYLTERLSKICI